MTGTTISNSYVDGVTLSNAAAYNPVSIAPGATITDAAGPGVYGTGTIDWTIANAGVVRATATAAGSYGIVLVGGGTITNLAGGIASGVYDGVAITGVGTVANRGSLVATDSTFGDGIVVRGGGSVSNAVGGGVSGGLNGIAMAAAGVVNNAGAVRGLTGNGVSLSGGGTVSNAATGVIVGYQIGVTLGTAGTVVNQGSIASGKTTGSGFYYDTATDVSTLLAGGVILDGGGVSNAAAGVISSYFFGVGLSGAGSVVNDGQVSASGTTSGFGVVLMDGGSITNDAAGTISGGVDAVLTIGTNTVTAVNEGTLEAGIRYGLDLHGADSYVSNAGSGTITAGYIGALLRGTNALAINAGSISAVMGVLEASGGTAVNRAMIVATGTGPNKHAATGIYQYHGGYVTNALGGTISSGSVGVLEAKLPGTVTNLGSITSSGRFTAGAGIELMAGGAVSNGVGGRITTQLFGVQIYGSGTVVNQGFILADDSVKGYGAGVWVKGPADISNASSGTISGGLFAVVLYNQSTVTNAGTIFGTNFAVSATPGYADRLIVVPGATFSGTVSGGNAVTSTMASVLELAAGTQVGSIAGLGSKYIDFAQVTVDAGAYWSLGGTVAPTQTLAFGGAGASLTLANPGSVAGTIAGFAVSDTIVLAGITGVTAATLGGHNLLTVSGGTGSPLTLQFDPKQSFHKSSFDFTTVGDNTDLIVPCFAAGTCIATPGGAVAVERLRVGDQVCLGTGGTAPVVWLGHRRVDCRRHPTPQAVLPVRVVAHAFGLGRPEADLLLSPDHAVFVDGVPIPVRCLVNDLTVRQESVATVTYWHVELPEHGVLLAEGLTVESYLDTGNRSAFANGGPVVAAHPDFARAVWERLGCAPLVLGGPMLELVRRRLLVQALALGYRPGEALPEPGRRRSGTKV